MTPGHRQERTAGRGPGGRGRRRARRRYGFGRSLPAAVALSALTLAAACAPEPGDENLKASFAAQIEGIASVSGFARTGDELTFTQNPEGDAAVAWRVTIDSVSLEPRPDDAVPVQGNVISSWYADGELVEPIGSIYTLPDEFFDAGLAQDCWALWDAEQATWGW
ncbi:MAG: hypothetical protein OXF93_09040 [Acidobacteria bacterium]|nr:hypothetical protein [Acidobacteriota bacterium]